MKFLFFILIIIVSGVFPIHAQYPEDVDFDGTISIKDIMQVVSKWGHTYLLNDTRTIIGIVKDFDTKQGIDGIFVEPEGSFLVGKPVDEYHLNVNDRGVYTKTTISNQGFFQITDAPIGKFILYFGKNDPNHLVYPVQKHEINIPNGEGVYDTGVFELYPEATLTGKIIGRIFDASTNMGINGAKVWLENGRTTYTETKILEGMFEFTNAPSGTYFLSASASKHISKSVMITVSDYSTTEQNLALEFIDVTDGMSIISGVVFDSSTGKIPNKSIDMYCYGIITDVNGNPLTLEYFSSTNVNDGSFAFYDVNPGSETPIKYTIIAGQNTTGFQPGTLTNIYPQPNQILDNLELSVVGKVGTISGKVTLVGLGGVEGITMEIYGLDGYVTHTQLDGSYKFEKVPLLDKLHEGHLIQAYSDNYNPDVPSTGYIRVKLYDDEFDPQVNATGIDFSFIAKPIPVSETGHLQGTITDIFGNPIEGISVTFTDVNGLPISRSSGADGAYFISGLLPQKTQAKAEDTRDILEREYSQQIRVVTIVKENITTQDFVLTPIKTYAYGYIYREINNVPDYQPGEGTDIPIAGATVELMYSNEQGGFNPVAVTNFDGRFDFLDAYAGRCIIRVSSQEYSVKEQIIYLFNRSSPLSRNPVNIQVGP